MKYALIESNVVKQISYQPEDGYIEVDDNVFADMVKKDDGSYDYTDEVKAVSERVAKEEEDTKTNREDGYGYRKTNGIRNRNIYR